jgi:hypothetical protein
MSAGSGRSPREAEDPLAELARLVSQGDTTRPSYGATGEPRSSYSAPAANSPSTPQPLRTGYSPYTPPAVDHTQDRLDPIGNGRGNQQAYDSRAYGAPAEPDYDPNDFFAEPAPRAAAAGGYGNYRDDDFDTDFQPPRSPFQDDFDDTDDGVYPAADEDIAEDMPLRSRGKLVIAAVVGLVLVGSIGAWALGGLGGGETADGAPPVIKAENDTPIKVVPEAKPVARAKESYDRIDPNATATVVPSAEEPGEKPAPRVILPGASSSPTEARMAETAPPQLAPSEPAAADSGMGRRVRTIAIRPDGSMAPPSAEPSMQAMAEPNPAPPAPIQGSGPAEGMSMQPGSEFGILSSESSPPQSASQQQEVPLPQPRPQLAQQDNYAVSAPQAPVAPQARASTEVPAPRSNAGGPPSTPQPQVILTNKRPLRPSGAPGPAAQNRPAPAAAVPARPVATVPVTGQPRQIAMAAPSAPQVATVAGSSGAFGVQLTAQRSEAEALAAFNALKQRYPQVLGAYSATVARADLGAERGVFYRAMVPAQSQSDASNLCIQFKASGVDCIVQRR